jgi:hypothetical protein
MGMAVWVKVTVEWGRDGVSEWLIDFTCGASQKQVPRFALAASQKANNLS